MKRTNKCHGSLNDFHTRGKSNSRKTMNGSRI
jgi:hypothetical protein